MVQAPKLRTYEDMAHGLTSRAVSVLKAWGEGVRMYDPPTQRPNLSCLRPQGSRYTQGVHQGVQVALPLGSKVADYRILRVSILRIVTMV